MFHLCFNWLWSDIETHVTSQVGKVLDWRFLCVAWIDVSTPRARECLSGTACQPISRACALVTARLHRLSIQIDSIVVNF